jgi:hypothetical protein
METRVKLSGADVIDICVAISLYIIAFTMTCAAIVVYPNVPDVIFICPFIQVMAIVYHMMCPYSKRRSIILVVRIMAIVLFFVNRRLVYVHDSVYIIALLFLLYMLFTVLMLIVLVSALQQSVVSENDVEKSIAVD